MTNIKRTDSVIWDEDEAVFLIHSEYDDTLANTFGCVSLLMPQLPDVPHDTTPTWISPYNKGPPESPCTKDQNEFLASNETFANKHIRIINT